MAKPAHASNSFDPHVVNSLLRKLDNYDAELLSERGSYMSKCRNIRENMKAVFDEAKAGGIPTKELRTLIKIRSGERKNVELYNNLEADQQEALRMLAATENVADLPLWRQAREQWKSVPGIDVARHAAGEHPEPMWDDSVKFKQL